MVPVQQIFQAPSQFKNKLRKLAYLWFKIHILIFHVLPLRPNMRLFPTCANGIGNRS